MKECTEEGIRESVGGVQILALAQLLTRQLKPEQGTI